MVGMNVFAHYINSDVTAQQVATHMGVNAHAIDVYFRAETLPSETIDNLSQVLDVTPAELTRPHPYTITLTGEERSAFDMMCGRYEFMDGISDILFDCMPYDTEWDQAGDITFHLHESQAWEINEFMNESDWCTNLSDRIVEKFQKLSNEIV